MKQMRFNLKLDQEETSKIATYYLYRSGNKKDSALSSMACIFNEALWERSRQMQ